MKNKKVIISSIVILSIISISLIIVMVKLLNKNINFPNFKISTKVSTELVLDKNYENKYEKIKIDSETSDIYIKKHNEENIKVVIYGEKENTKVEDLDNILNIKTQTEPCVGFCFNNYLHKIEIYLPSNYDKNIIINNNYGDIEIDEFLNSDIEVIEDCGDVSISGGNNIKVENNYGNINIGKANKLDIKESAGDIKIDEVNDIKIESDYGDIKIKNVLNSLDIKQDCGDVEIENITLNKDSKISNDFGDITIDSTNDIFIDAEVELGDKKIKKNNRKSNITLEIENECGDIKVNN